MNTNINIKIVTRFGLLYYIAYFRGVQLTSAMSEAHCYSQAHRILSKGVVR